MGLRGRHHVQSAVSGFRAGRRRAGARPLLAARAEQRLIEQHGPRSSRSHRQRTASTERSSKPGDSNDTQVPRLDRLVRRAETSCQEGERSDLRGAGCLSNRARDQTARHRAATAGAPRGDSNSGARRGLGPGGKPMIRLFGGPRSYTTRRAPNRRRVPPARPCVTTHRRTRPTARACPRAAVTVWTAKTELFMEVRTARRRPRREIRRASHGAPDLQTPHRGNDDPRPQDGRRYHGDRPGPRSPRAPASSGR